MKKGEVYKFEIEDYAFEGKGIARVDMPDSDDTDKKFIVFVEGAYPGDIVEAQIRRKKRSYAEAKVVKIVESAPDRVKPNCNYFDHCGGCKQQDLKYESQLKYKEAQVQNIFEKMGGLTRFNMLPIVPSQNIFYYRNKMEFSFADKRWLTKEEIESNNDLIDRNFALGLHIPRIFDKVLDINECWLQSEISNKILNFTRDFFKSRGVSIYSTKTHVGYLRNLVIKQAGKTNDLMVNLVTASDDNILFQEYADSLKKEIPEISTIINNVNEKKSQTAVGDFENVYHGDGNIFDKIGKYSFRISANSFFQTNTLQGQELYETALNFAEFNKEDVVFDLYCGAGTISIFISDAVKEVYGFEFVESSIADAKVNTEQNNITNAKFFQQNLDKSFLPILEKENIPKPDVIITDPPRSGMNPKTVQNILELNPKKIVYVSCNPTTQVRDIKLLLEGGYELINLQPVDMFPHTYHIETVALLKK